MRGDFEEWGGGRFRLRKKKYGTTHPETGRARPSWGGPSMSSGSGGCHKAQRQRVDC